MWLGDERHILTKSFVVFVPCELKHCPMNILRADRPIFRYRPRIRGLKTLVEKEIETVDCLDHVSFTVSNMDRSSALQNSSNRAIYAV